MGCCCREVCGMEGWKCSMRAGGQVGCRGQMSVDLDTVGRGVEPEELGWELGYERTEAEVEQRLEKGGQE